MTDPQVIVNLGTGGSDLNGQNGSTGSADSNDATFLDWTGSNYVYLPGGANNITCTAPATVTQYKAYPLGGGASTDGAASGGATFTFSTSGSWLRVDLLDVSNVVLASFDASLLTSGDATGLTDTYAVSWTITRATSGRKSVAVVSPVWLFGTDDRMIVSDNALLDFTTSTDTTVVAVARQWATPGNFRDVFNKGLSAPRLFLENQSTTYQYRFAVQSTTSGVQSVLVPSTYSEGSLSAFGGIIDGTNQTAQAFISSTLSGTIDISTVGDITNSDDVLIGNQGGAGIDFELIAIVIFRRVLTAAEIASVTTYYENRLS